MDVDRLHRLQHQQDGVISRRQVLDCGGDDSLIEKQVRRREWARVHRGVFVNHTGEPTPAQMAWAAVLYYWPAALADASALELQGFRTTGRQDPLVHVAVEADRRPRPVDGVRVHRLTNLAELVQPNRMPPRLRAEDALLRSAAKARSETQAIAVVGDACQCGRTTAARLLSRLDRHPTLTRHAFLAQLLADVATGAYSVLEHRYLTDVERPHGLPTGKRQRRVSQGRGPAYRDVEYRGFGTVVELDGRLGHEEARDRWADLDRDIDSIVDGDVTLRAGWKQVDESCRLAIAVGRVLGTRGWAGPLRPCSSACLVLTAGGSGLFPAPGAGKSPRPQRERPA